MAIERRQAAGFRERLYTYLRVLGPGFVSGASDTDPTTVATMSVVGSTTVFGLSWLTLLVYPMLANIQIVSARVGVVTRRGLQELVRERYGRGWGAVLLASVLAVNVITIGADLEAGAAALGLMTHLDYRWFALPLGAVLLLLLVFGSYGQVERVLKFALLVLLAYIAAAFLAHPKWGEVFRATIAPRLSLQSDYVAGALAIVGTTLTSYAYVWEVVEESERKLPVRRLGLAQADAGLGMVVAVALFWFILIATGATAGVHHRQVETAQQAAESLRPLAGPAAAYLFGIGLLASSCIAVPVLAATSAYLAGAEFGFPFGLSKKLKEAVRFYLVAGVAMLIAVAISLLGIPAVRLLFWASIAGGLGTPISLAFLLVVAQDRRVMRGKQIHLASRVIGWLTLGVVTGISLWFLATQVVGPLLGR
jgi:Mn2+/Fe2+ NRAMP family transporter